MLLEGLNIPLTTPFRRDGSLHPDKLAANVIRYSKSPAAGLIALAPNAGEPTLLTDAETGQVLRTVAEAAAPEKVLLANVSRDSVHATLSLAENAAVLAYDAILVGPPKVIALTQRQEVLTYFQIIADRSPLPVVLLSANGGSHSIPQGITAELGAHPNIFGMYSHGSDSSEEDNELRPADLKKLLEELARITRQVIVTSVFSAVTNRMQRAAEANIATIPQHSALVSAASLARNPAAAATAIANKPPSAPVKTRTRTVGFQIIAGSSASLLDSLRAGAVGIAPAFAACAPQACYEVYAAWKDADQPLAEEKQQRLASAAEFAEALGPGGLKFGCDLNGYFGGVPRLPYLPPAAQDRAELERRMRPMRT